MTTYKLNLKSKGYEHLQNRVEIQIEGKWKEISGKSWMNCNGNPACLIYAMRSGFADDIPTDNEVYYGKINGLGYLVHVSELGERTDLPQGE